MSELNIPGFIAFLRGEVTIDGHWFGGDGPIRGGIRRNFWWREHLPKLSSHIERQDAEIAQLRADLSESRRLLDEARAQKPVAFRYRIGGPTVEWRYAPGDATLTRSAIVESEPLYAAAPVPAQPAADVADICNAYESGVGHAGRPTAKVNPYREGSPEHEAYAIGASGTKHNGTATVPEAVAKDVSALDAAGQFNRKVAYAWFPLRISRKRQLISDCGITLPQALTESDSQWAMRALLAMLERAECRSAILSAADTEVKNG